MTQPSSLSFRPSPTLRQLSKTRPNQKKSWNTHTHTPMEEKNHSMKALQFHPTIFASMHDEKARRFAVFFSIQRSSGKSSAEKSDPTREGGDPPALMLASPRLPGKEGRKGGRKEGLKAQPKQQENPYFGSPPPLSSPL